MLVAKKMKILRNEYQEPAFESEEWRTGHEISGLFFTHVRQRRSVVGLFMLKKHLMKT